MGSTHAGAVECGPGAGFAFGGRYRRRPLSGATGRCVAAGGCAEEGIVMSPDVRRVLGRDLLQQAYGAMRHDLRKTLLTMLGMAWGIATVVLLLAYGDGFGRAIQAIFANFGATEVGIFPGRTSQQAGGSKAGVAIRFTEDDIDLIRNNAPLVHRISR